MRRLILIVDDIRSAHNVGSLLRTADAMAVERVYLVGITPYPPAVNDSRLPHIAARAERQISKTALGAEKTVEYQHVSATDLPKLLKTLKKEGFAIAGLEQTPAAKLLDSFQPPPAVALIVGNELKGLGDESLKAADFQLSIAMLGTKESLNVAVAAGIALYHLRFSPPTVDKSKL